MRTRTRRAMEDTANEGRSERKNEVQKESGSNKRSHRNSEGAVHDAIPDLGR